MVCAPSSDRLGLDGAWLSVDDRLGNGGPVFLVLRRDYSSSRRIARRLHGEQKWAIAGVAWSLRRCGTDHGLLWRADKRLLLHLDSVSVAGYVCLCGTFTGDWRSQCYRTVPGVVNLARTFTRHGRLPASA